MDEITFLPLRGAELLPYLEVVGRLRLEVFHEYPYLYEGTLEDEHAYLRTYTEAASSLVVLALRVGRVVGATTCLAMTEAEPSFCASFLEQGWDLQQVCYFGESVLLPEFRGRGVGKVFFQRRLEHALALGARWAAFCAVDRPEDHPLRPPGYRSLDGFWSSLGFIQQPELRAAFTWKEVGQAVETTQSLTFWLKELF
jgi:GNAT superfamily N-acetyltransferase